MDSLPPAYFDDLYKQDIDPWKFRGSEYEAAKYAATLDAIPRGRYAAGLEIGCSIGMLTRMLAARCDDLLATDVAAAALDEARALNADQPQVRFELRQFPCEVSGDGLRGDFDLMVFSEVLYYLDAPTLEQAAAVTVGMARPGADIVLVHWLGETPDYPLNGNEAAEGFMAALNGIAEPEFHAATPQYRIDRLRRV
ncbi:methyltransferase [Polymorphobacter glacialis]|uniref:Methyltransferase n=1 Tax=Sandarakinorhabdus glacialis TaxID=1614636 RepID=A0A916ZVU7_9SPHN|nr:SAM-dependent methyltransferase [Polymorphobacter glacialis]GGE13947.1 methyltransferase [Polymorphobacter glacialis]